MPHVVSQALPLVVDVPDFYHSVQAGGEQQVPAVVLSGVQPDALHALRVPGEGVHALLREVTPGLIVLHPLLGAALRGVVPLAGLVHEPGAALVVVLLLAVETRSLGNLGDVLPRLLLDLLLLRNTVGVGL